MRRSSLAVLCLVTATFSLCAQETLPLGAIQRYGTAKFRHGSRIQTLAYSPNGRVLAAGGGNDPVRLWDTDSGKEIHQLKDQWVNAVAFSPYGSVVVTAGAFKKIRMWELSNGKEFGSFEGHATAVQSLTISNHGALMASGGQDGSVLLWEFATRKVITPFKGHQGDVTGLAFSPDNLYLASTSMDRTVRIWDIENGKFIRFMDAGCAAMAVSFSGDGKQLFTAGDDKLIRVWDPASGKLLGTLTGHQDTVVSLLVPRTGKGLYSGSLDGTIRFWEDGKESRMVRRNVGDSDAIALTKNGKFLATAGYHGAIRIFDAESGQEQITPDIPVAPIFSLALSRDGKTLVNSSTDGILRSWDTATGKMLAKWTSQQMGDIVLALSPDGGTLASASGVDAIRTWSPKTGQELTPLANLQRDPVLSLTWSPEGKRLAVGHRSGFVRLWNVNESKPVQEFKYTGPVYALTFHPDGQVLAATGTNKVVVWDLATAKELTQFGSREGPEIAQPIVASLAFHPEGRTLLLGCVDGIARLVDWNTGKDVRTFEGHQSAIQACGFTSDGRTLATASADHVVRLWESFSGKTINQFKGHVGPVQSLALDPSNRGVYSAGADASILRWDFTGLSKDGELPPLKLAQGEMSSAWMDLASDEAPRAHPILWKLTAAPADSVPFLATQVFLVDPSAVDKLFADMNHPSYATRKKATDELERFGMWMKGRLDEAFTSAKDEEVRRRIELLVHKLRKPGVITIEQERMRVRRVMLLLEHTGTPEAIDLLRKLAQGAPEKFLQEEAASSLARIGRRRPA